MNFNTLKQELHKKIRVMSKEDFTNFIDELEQIYYKTHPYQFYYHDRLLKALEHGSNAEKEGRE